MKIEFTEIAMKEFLDLDKSIQIQFKKAIEKILENPIRRHLKYGIPSQVINVTKQARIVYDLENDLILILHCFSNHSDYEKWYKSYKLGGNYAIKTSKNKGRAWISNNQ